MKEENVFTWEGEVRDNETDLQGIVNNANYFVYMAHARHKHLSSLGIDFSVMHNRGFNLVLVRSEIYFKASLKSGDGFIVTSKLEPMGRIRFVFSQQVIRKSDQKMVIEAKNIATCISITSGRPIIPEELKNILNLEPCVQN